MTPPEAACEMVRDPVEETAVATASAFADEAGSAEAVATFTPAAVGAALVVACT